MSPADLCIALQYFVKQDTTLAALETIRHMAGGQGVTLLLLQDGIKGARRAEEWAELHDACAARVSEWVDASRDSFLQIIHQRQPHNLGTCATTRTIIDAGFELGNWVLFAEDDVLFCDAALDWFVPMINSDVFASDDVWAVAGESKAFDARGRSVAPARVEADRLRANSFGLMSCYVLFNFLPSSCFATTRAKWAEFGKTRGQPNGDRDVNLRCRTEGRRSLWPVIARCRDEGMHHPLGYSMMVREGDASVVAGKAVYLTADDLDPVNSGFRPLDTNLNGLFVEWRDA